jgi:hypothetical protein
MTDDIGDRFALRERDDAMGIPYVSGFGKD